MSQPPIYVAAEPTREDFELMLEVDIAYSKWLQRTARVDKIARPKPVLTWAFLQEIAAELKL